MKLGCTITPWNLNKPIWSGETSAPDKAKTRFTHHQFHISIFPTNIVSWTPCITANFWTKQNVHIIGRDVNFQPKTLSCFMIVAGSIQLPELDKKLRVCVGLHWNSLPTVQTYRLAIIICLEHQKEHMEDRVLTMMLLLKRSCAIGWCQLHNKNGIIKAG